MFFYSLVELEHKLMAAGRRGKDLIGPLLVVNLVVFLIVLGLAGWSLDKFINGEQNHPRMLSLTLSNSYFTWVSLRLLTVCVCATCLISYTDLGGNSSTSFMLIFALIAGVVGACFLLCASWASASSGMAE